MRPHHATGTGGLSADPEPLGVLRRLDVVAFSAKQHACRGAKRFSSAIEALENFGDVIRRQKRVGIAQGDELAARDANRLIRRCSEAAVLCVAHGRQEVCEVREQARRLVRGSVVHDDDLGLVEINLTQERTQTLKSVVGFVEDGDDD